MIEVFDGLFVGNEHDYETTVRHRLGWRVVHACKEPYHRQALRYSGRAAPKAHPEYLVARRGDRLILNLIDAADPAYIPKSVIDVALQFIEEGRNEERPVFVHCNEGGSRAPSIAFLYLVSRTDRFVEDDIDSALQAFLILYPPYRPARGMQGFIRTNYAHYAQGQKS